MSLVTFYDADLDVSDIELFKSNWLNDRCIHFAANLLQYTGDKSFNIDVATLSEEPLSSSSVTTDVVLKFIDPSIVSFMKLQCEDEDEFRDLAVGLGLTNIYANSEANLPEIVYCFPINDSNTLLNPNQGSHWSLAVCHINKRVVYHLDSCKSAGSRCGRLGGTQMLAVQETIKAFSKVMSQVTLPCQTLPWSADSFTVIESATPQQCNSSDCGVYVLLFMQAISDYLIKGPSISRNSKCEVCPTSSIEEAIDFISHMDRQETRNASDALRIHFASSLTALRSQSAV